MTNKIKQHWFLFEELIKRDFKKKYKRTILGMGWSVLSPLMTLLVMRLVFTQFFGRDTLYYTTYLFSGNLIMAYFKEATNGGMSSLMENSSIFSKVNVPKYLFLFSKIVAALINFLLTLIIYFIFVALDGISFNVRFVILLFPIVCLTFFSIGVGMVLSALYIFFKDIKYLYEIFLTLLTYLSAIFYYVDAYPPMIQKLFLLNPVYVYIKYFRLVVINDTIPSVSFHFLCILYALALLGIGCFIYKKYNHDFLYYI